jgi:hypothetical protein
MCIFDSRKQIAPVNVCIVGGSGWGKTTFLGLFYLALNAYAVWNPKIIRFTPELATATYLDDKVVLPMLSGKFPDKTIPGIREEIKISFSIKKKRSWKRIDIHSFDIAGEDIKHTIADWAIRRGRKNRRDWVREQDSIESAIINSDIIIFVLDSIIFNSGATMENAKRYEADAFMQKMCLAIGEYRRMIQTDKIKGIGIIFAKYDRVDPKLALGRVNFHSFAGGTLPADVGDDEKIIHSLFEKIFRNYLPLTAGALNTLCDSKIIQDLAYFRSGIILSQDKQSIEQKTPIAIPLTFASQELVQLSVWLSSIV